MKTSTTLGITLAGLLLALVSCSTTSDTAVKNQLVTTNLSAEPSTIAPIDPPYGITGTIIKHDAFPSKFVDARNVHVWLPPSYASHPYRKYPVLYANDGQNQFDPKECFIGVDWALDETMTRLITEGKVREAIVVAIWNTPKRTREYIPQKALLSAIGTPRETTVRKTMNDFGSDLDQRDWFLADAYLKFLVTGLKPFIDKEYRTQPGRRDTFIMGSSAGAMISLYAISEYPKTFGGAACLSTHLPLADGILVEYFKDHLPAPATHKIYFDFGTETLDKTYEPYQIQMAAALEQRGYRSGVNTLTRKFPGDDHSERAWRKRVHVPLEFLLGQSGKGGEP